MKLCIDCKQMKIGLGTQEYLCTRFKSEISPVDGRELKMNQYCDDERANPLGCGPNGKYWEAK